ncbi:hypothetical protein [Dysosmobacter sp.]|jgi:hypothetical protein|uniref:hypothetical protein n=1 Tax=Dysosmobacter sp. TaxID=2591382 RepID=UPI0026735B5E|nr:hypothetical protein [uncultured Dysosmobacter sp.]
MKEARYTGIGLKSLCILTLRRCRLILLAALLGALLMGIYGGASYSGRQAAASEAREAALEDLQTQRDSLSDEMDSYKQNIKEAERQIRDAQYVIKDRQLTIENYQQQIDGLDVRRADCTAALEKARQVLNTTSNDEARVQAASAVHELNEALTGYTNQELSWQLYILNYQNEIETLKDTSAQDKVIEENEKLLEDKQKELDEMDEEIRKLEIPASASGPVVSAIKFAIVGAVLLACLTCGVVVVLGCFDRRLHDGEELASSCGARLLGDLRRPAETRCPLERRLQRWELGASVPETSEQYDQISANIRLLTEPGEIVVTGTEDADEKTVRELSDRLSPVGYTVTGCADPLKNADALLFAADKPVILVETAGVSDMREVVRLVNLLREGHGSVAGAVIR